MDNKWFLLSLHVYLKSPATAKASSTKDSPSNLVRKIVPGTRYWNRFTGPGFSA